MTIANTIKPPTLAAIIMTIMESSLSFPAFPSTNNRFEYFTSKSTCTELIQSAIIHTRAWCCNLAFTQCFHFRPTDTHYTTCSCCYY